MDHRTTTAGVHAGRDWVKVTRGAFRSTSAPDPYLATLRAWQRVLPEDACLTHLAAAAVLGLWLPHLSHAPVPVVQLPLGRVAPERPGLRAIRSRSAGPPLDVHGLRLASPTDVLLACARDLAPLDLLVLVDSALARGLVEVAQLRDATTHRRRGVPRLRAALEWADPRSESPWETLLRELHRCAEVSVTTQYEVTHQGHFVARADLRLDGHQVIHEYDGDTHLTPGAQRRDLRRSRALVSAGWVRRGYTSQDLIARAPSVFRDIDETLGRTPAISRLHHWLALVRESSYSPASRHALALRTAEKVFGSSTNSSSFPQFAAGPSTRPGLR